jgi:uncharacterized membrane protein
VTLLFLTAAIPILLDKEWITVAWALEAAALAWLSTRVREENLVRASAVLAAATFVRLVVNPALWRLPSARRRAHLQLVSLHVRHSRDRVAAAHCSGDPRRWPSGSRRSCGLREGSFFSFF